MVRGRWFLPIIRSFQSHPLYYAGWFFVLIAGLSCGFCTVSLLVKTNGYSFEAAAQNWIAGYVRHEKSTLELLLSSLFVNGRWLLLMLLAGLMRFGSVFLFIVPAARGFGIGFFMGMMSSSFEIGGLLFACVVVLMQNVLLLPCYAHAGTYSLFRIQTNRRLHPAKSYLLPSFIFFGAAVIMDCSILPLLIGVLGSGYV